MTVREATDAAEAAKQTRAMMARDAKPYAIKALLSEFTVLDKWLAWRSRIEVASTQRVP